MEHPEFIKLCQLMTPGYQTPSRKQLGEKILDNAYNSEIASRKKVLSGETVSMCLDGWSNVHNDSIVCCSVVCSSGYPYLADIIDTSGFLHTGDYLATLAKQAINSQV